MQWCFKGLALDRLNEEHLENVFLKIQILGPTLGN